MNVVGFTIEKDRGIVKAGYLDAPFRRIDEPLSEEEQNKIIHYIENGEYIFGLTLALADGDRFIGPYVIRSDGKWVWPSHFSYYLMKNGFNQLDADFLEHMRAENYAVRSLSEAERRACAYFMEGELINYTPRQRRK